MSLSNQAHSFTTDPGHSSLQEQKTQNMGHDGIVDEDIKDFDVF